MYLDWEELAQTLDALCLDVSALTKLAAQLAESWQRAQEMLRRVEQMKRDLEDYFFGSDVPESDPQRRKSFRPERGNRPKVRKSQNRILWYTSGFL